MPPALRLLDGLLASMFFPSNSDCLGTPNNWAGALLCLGGNHGFSSKLSSTKSMTMMGISDLRRFIAAISSTVKALKKKEKSIQPQLVLSMYVLTKMPVFLEHYIGHPGLSWPPYYYQQVSLTRCWIGDYC